MKRILLISILCIICIFSIPSILAEQRTPNSINTGNSFLWSTKQINYLDEDGKYKPINLNIKSTNDGYVVMDNNFEAFFSNDGKKFQIKKKFGKIIGYTIKDSRITSPSINKNKIKYSNIFKGIDIEYIIERNRLKENIIIKEEPDIDKIYFDFDKKILIKDGYLYRDGIFRNTKEWQYIAPFIEGRNDKIDSKFTGVFSSTLEIDLHEVKKTGIYPTIIDPSFKEQFSNDLQLEEITNLTLYNGTGSLQTSLRYSGKIAGAYQYMYDDFLGNTNGLFNETQLNGKSCSLINLGMTNTSRYQNTTGALCYDSDGLNPKPFIAMYWDNNTAGGNYIMKARGFNEGGFPAIATMNFTLYNQTDDTLDLKTGNYDVLDLEGDFQFAASTNDKHLIYFGNYTASYLLLSTTGGGSAGCESGDLLVKLILDRAAEQLDVWSKKNANQGSCDNDGEGDWKLNINNLDISSYTQWYLTFVFQSAQTNFNINYKLHRIFLGGYNQTGRVVGNQFLEGNSSDFFIKTAQVDSIGASYYDGGLSFYLSIDNGTTWKNVSIDDDLTFGAFETKNLKWAINFSNTHVWNSSWIDTLNISWTEQPFSTNISYNRLHNCTHVENGQSLGTRQTLNYTIRDEEDSKLINATLTHIYRISDSGTTFEYNFNSTNSESLINTSSGIFGGSRICLYPISYNYTNEKLQVQTESEGYDTRTLYAYGSTYNSTSVNRTIYLLKTTSSSEIAVNVRDNFGNGLKNYLVEVWQQDLSTGTIILISTDITDINGATIHNLKTSLSTLEYKFIVKDSSGIIRYIGDFQKLTSSSYTIVIGDILDNILENAENMQNIPHNLSWLGRNSFNLSFTYNDTNISSKICLYVVRIGVYNDTTLTEECSTDRNHTFLYHTGNISGTYYAEGYGIASDDDNKYTIDTLNFEINITAIQIFGAIGLIILIVGYFFAMGAAFASERPTLFFVLPVLWTALAGILQIIPLGILSIIGLIVVGGIVLWKSEV